MDPGSYVVTDFTSMSREQLDIFLGPSTPAHWRLDHKALQRAKYSLMLRWPVSVTPMQPSWWHVLAGDIWGGDHTIGFLPDDSPIHVVRVNANRPDASLVSEHIWHELGHAVQAEKYAATHPDLDPFQVLMERFADYQQESAKKGYWYNRYEVDARSYQTRAKDHPLTIERWDGTVWGAPYKIGGDNGTNPCAGMVANSTGHPRANDSCAWYSDS